MLVYGDCLSTMGFQEVTISELGADSCRLKFPAGLCPDDQVLTIWIGALGPITGLVSRRRGAEIWLDFHERLDDRVTRHFSFA